MNSIRQLNETSLEQIHSCKGSDWISLVFAHPFPLNSGAPIASANFISDGKVQVSPYLAIPLRFWFQGSLCSEYQANIIFQLSTFWWNVWKNEVWMKIHPDLPWRSFKTPYKHNQWYDLKFLLAWCFGQLSAKRSPNHSLEESCNFLFSKHERPLQLSEGITNDHQICKVQG